jgi:hypothetical protein
MKETFYYFKDPITLFLIGWMVRILGTTRKILHAPNADTWILVSAILQCLALVYFILLLYKIKTSK